MIIYNISIPVCERSNLACMVVITRVITTRVISILYTIPDNVT